jgi:hypothetical protein
MRLAWFALLLVFAVLLQAPARAEDRMPNELAHEILSDPAYQKDLMKRPQRPEHSNSGCDDGKIRVRRSGSAAPGAGGSIATLLAWLAAGVAVALSIIWIITNYQRREPGALSPSDSGAEPQNGTAAKDPSILAIENLAARGLFAEAVHEMLLLAVVRLAARHHRELSGWLTSRELTRLLPSTDDERGRFARLVEAVERSLFGGQAIDRTTYERCFDDFGGLAL